MFKKTAIFLLLLLCSTARGQVAVEAVDTEGRRLLYHQASSRAAGEAQVIAWVDSLRLEGYLEAGAGQQFWADSTLATILHLGPAYELAELSNGNIPEAMLSAAGFREKLYRGRPFRIAEVQSLQDALLKYAEDNGFPFARVWLDSIRITNGQVSAQLFAARGPLVLIKKIQLEGDAKISQAFLQRYLGLSPGAPYDKAQILRIRNRIQELPFIDLCADPTVTIVGQEASIRLELRKKRASRFDFVLGVLPQNANGQQANGRSVLITGTFNGELQNQFGKGERIYAAFEQLRPETQELELEFTYPYLLGLPFGTDLSFQLYKRDTSYLDLESDLGLQYLLEGGNYLKAFWNNRSSTLLTVNEARLEATGQLPENLDVRNAYFGLEYAMQQLDYRFNPRKGWLAQLRAGAGTRRISRNNRVVELGFESLYDTLELRTFQYKLSANLEGYLPLFARSTLKAGLRGGAILSPSPVYFNEQFRIGGNRILRGFDEESIFATRYGLGTLEYRLLIGQNSFLYLFGDMAWVDDATPVRQITDWPYGFGAGLTFETGVGLFGLSLAYGRQLGNPIDFSAPKVHFGYVSRFN